MHSPTGGEAYDIDRALPTGWELQESHDFPGDAAVRKGRVLWNVIDPAGEHRGQILLTEDDDI